MFALALPRLYIRRLLHRFRGAPSRREPNLELLISQDVHGFAEALEVDDFALAQEADGVVYIGVVGEAKDVIVDDSRLLLGGEILGDVGEGIALGGDGCSAEGHACGGAGVYACSVVNEVGVKAACFYLIGSEISCELIDN